MRDKCDTTRIKVINAHSLHFGIEDDQIHDQFYRELGETARQTPVGWVVILLGDMNANLGDSESPGVGPFFEDRENNNGTRLRAFAAEYNMAFMNTYKDGVPLSTWRSSRGQEHRIDGIAISMKDVGRVLHAGVHKDVNMAFSTEIDHWPVSLQVRMCPLKWDDDSRDKKLSVDLQDALVARAQELDSAGRPFQRLHVLNGLMRGVGRAWLSTGTPARPRSSCSGAGKRTRACKSESNVEEEVLGFCCRTDVNAGSYSSTNICGPWYLRLPHRPWKSGTGSRRPLVPFMPFPRKFLAT